MSTGGDVGGDENSILLQLISAAIPTHKISIIVVSLRPKSPWHFTNLITFKLNTSLLENRKIGGKVGGVENLQVRGNSACHGI